MRFSLIIFCVLLFLPLFSQEDNFNDKTFYIESINDPSLAGQRHFVSELFEITGHEINRIQIHQSLANQARVFRVKYNKNTQGSFVMVRWDKKKKENFIANKLIDPGVYYNLNAVLELIREQTKKSFFTPRDVALQPRDQEKLSPEDLIGLREIHRLKEEEEEVNKKRKKNKRRKETREAKKIKPK